MKKPQRLTEDHLKDDNFLKGKFVYDNTDKILYYFFDIKEKKCLFTTNSNEGQPSWQSISLILLIVKLKECYFF